MIENRAKWDIQSTLVVFLWLPGKYLCAICFKCSCLWSGDSSDKLSFRI